MTRDERYACIAAGMVYEAGMTIDETVVAIIASGIKPKVAKSPAVRKSIEQAVAHIPAPTPEKVREGGTE